MKNNLRELSVEETKGYKGIGTAIGNFDTCLYMASKHVPNFKDRAVGFRAEKNNMTNYLNRIFSKGQVLQVTFYEKEPVGNSTTQIS